MNENSPGKIRDSVSRSKSILTTVITLAVFLLSAMFAPSAVALGQEHDGRIVFHIKSGDAEDIDEVYDATHGMQLATHVQSAGMNVTIYLDEDGVNLGLRQPSFIFNDANAMLKNLIANGSAVVVCTPCLAEAGHIPEDLVEGAQMANPEKMANVLTNATVIDY